MTSTQSSDAATLSAQGFSWRETSAPKAGKYNDVYFVNRDLGWAANTNGTIHVTADGGKRWIKQILKVQPQADIRCLAFSSATHGWAGALDNPGEQLATTTTGGAIWEWVKDLPADAPQGVCGLSALNNDVVVAAGANRPFGWKNNPPPAIMRTIDGGRTWTAVDMRTYASCLIDVHFTSQDHGLVVGAFSDPDGPPRDPNGTGRENLMPVVLFTEDGGKTWVDRVAGIRKTLKHGEWAWKIQFLDDGVGYVSLMSFVNRPGAFLKTTDGGESWRRMEVNDARGTQSIKGVGFVDSNQGWVGGADRRKTSEGGSSGTRNGGADWTVADEVGKQINQFRFIGKPIVVGYAAGETVYKYSDRPVGAESPAEPVDATIADEITATDDGRRVDIPIVVPQGAHDLRVAAWDEYGFAESILEQTDPEPGPRTVTWDTSGLSGFHFVRVTVDDDAQSRAVLIDPS